jgi:hypothetical protein
VVSVLPFERLPLWEQRRQERYQKKGGIISDPASKANEKER